MDFIKKLTIYLMLFVGFGSCLLGFGIGIVETIHLLKSEHPFAYPPYVGAGIFIIGGAGLIQTKSVKDAVDNLTDALPLVRSIKPGGKRKTDPPITEEKENGN